MDKDHGPKAGNCWDHHIRRLAWSVVPARRLESRCFNWGVDNHLTAIVDNASPKMITFIKGLFAGSTNLLIGSIIAGKGYPLQSIGVALLVGIVSYGLSIVLYVTSAQQLGATRPRTC